jgi:hypothetical protein
MLPGGSTGTAVVPSYAQERRLRHACAPAGGPPGPRAKTIPVVCRPPAPVDTAALDAAVRAFIGRHPALQYQFSWRGGRVGMRWVGHRAGEFRCEVTQRSGLPDDAGAEESFVRQRIDLPFDVLQWPLLRCGVLQSDQPVVYLSMDHLVADGWSTFLAKVEIEALYAEQVSGRPAQLRPPGDFLRYSMAQRRRYADGPALDSQVAAFQQLLGGRPVHPSFPLDHASWTLSAGRYREVHLLDAPSVDSFTRICRAAKTTLFMGILAGYGIAVHESTGHQEAGTLVALHNREEPGVQEAIGWYANMLPLYFPTGPVERFGDVVTAVRAHFTALLGHHQLPLARLLDRLPDGYYNGAGETTPTCFVSFVDARSSTEAGWQRLEAAPAYRVGYGMWFFLKSDGLSMVTASPRLPGESRVLDGFESTLTRVLRTVANR